ncbi:hypothetical protein ABZ922_34570 [Streptomyces shenzhenensis]
MKHLGTAVHGVPVGRERDWIQGWTLTSHEAACAADFMFQRACSTP